MQELRIRKTRYQKNSGQKQIGCAAGVTLYYFVQSPSIRVGLLDIELQLMKI